MSREIVAEQVREVVFGDAVIVARLDQRRPLVGHGHLGAQHVEMRHGAGIIAMLLVFEFLLQQFHRRLAHGDLLRGEQDVVISQAHLQ